MAIPIPSIEPTEFVSGATVKWTRSLGDYPASTWTLKYYIRSVSQGGGYLDVTATADGDTHSVTIAATDTATLVAGEYEWQAEVTSGSEVAFPDKGYFTVKPALELEAGGVDRRSIAKRALEKIEAVILNRATRDDLSYTLPGVGMTLSKIPPDDLLRWYDYFKAEVAKEQAAEDLANGKGGGNNIWATFSRPT